MRKKMTKRPPGMLGGLIRLLIAAGIIAGVYWGIGGTSTNVNQSEVVAYVRANELDVIEWKDGRKSIGKIVGETPKSCFLKNPKGVEEKIDLAAVKTRRKASDAELEIAKILLIRNSARAAARRPAISENLRRAYASVGDWINAQVKYVQEVMAARRAKGDLESRLAAERAREGGGGEDISPLQKILQLISSGGMPAEKKKE